MRLIDADKARETATIDLVVHHLDRQPTIDAVPVVRCKDCIHYVRSDENNANYCGLYCGQTGILTEDNFCSYGERKDGDGNG